MFRLIALATAGFLLVIALATAGSLLATGGGSDGPDPSSSGTRPASDAALKICESLFDPESGATSVETAYESTVALVADWGDVADLRSLGADEPVFVCLINGAFPKSPPGAAPGSTPRSYDRALFLVPLVGEPSHAAIYGYAESLSWTDGPVPVNQ